MKGSITGKLILTAIIVGWAILNLVPMQDTPFATFIKTRATANEAQFKALLDIAQERVDVGKDTEEAVSIYTALRDLGQMSLPELHRAYFSEQPMEAFAKSWIANEQESTEILANARKAVDGGTQSSLGDALNTALRGRPVDLHALFFNDINLVDIKNIRKKNDTLMSVLYDESLGNVKLGLDLQGGTAVTLRIDEDAETVYERESRLDKAIEIMAKRVNGLGVAEPMIREVPPDGIEIQMPGLSTSTNPDAADILTKAARLEFCEVHRTAVPGSSAKPPLGYREMVEVSEDKDGHPIEQRMYVRQIPEADGSIIERAGVAQLPNGSFEVTLKMTGEGADVFTRVTKKISEKNSYNSVGRLAIVLDGELVSAPSVRDTIAGGRASISGNFSQREAIELANVLNNPLEFDLQLDEMYEVGPTLAEDARDASISAAQLGAILVILFMIAYYLSSGVVAVISVILNLIVVLGVLASVGATITLPGVAALVLTLGMAVDANILIFERIREELLQGKSIKNALSAGYSKAYSTIIDANVTTMITAAILIWLGTGPVKGFGVTLAIGIGSSMFAALVISRAFLEIMVVLGVKKLMPFWFKAQSNFDFLSKRKPAFITSWIIVLIGLVVVASKGDKIYGIEFLGGSELTIDFNQEHKPSIEKIYEVAETAELGEIIPVYQRVVGQTSERLKVQTTSENGQAVFKQLQAAFPEAELQKVGENIIGASVSDSIKRNAVYSVVVALIGILLYVALRFEFGYGIGAVVATIHDVFMTIGIFVMFGNQFTAPMLAAILMIVGYSINDTIVVFDRIREELELNPEFTLKKVVNLAINRTLSRTALTSITTFMAALALFIFGAGVINDFALIFLIGILTGTFSSVFIASPVFYWWHKGDRKHVEERELTRPSYEWEASSKKTKTKVEA